MVFLSIAAPAGVLAWHQSYLVNFGLAHPIGGVLRNNFSLLPFLCQVTRKELFHMIKSFWRNR